MFAFWKIWCALFSSNHCFEICLFPLLSTVFTYFSQVYFMKKMVLTPELCLESSALFMFIKANIRGKSQKIFTMATLVNF